jgi:5-methylcytosine-specific restriction endonuclease McrA
MGGWMFDRICVCVYVSCLGSRLGVPAISPSLPDVNKKISWSKKGRQFDWPLRVLKIGILKI